jgi:hypothetical protein
MKSSTHPTGIRIKSHKKTKRKRKTGKRNEMNVE